MCVQPNYRRYRWPGDGELMLKEVVHRQAAGEDLSRAEMAAVACHEPYSTAIIQIIACSAQATYTWPDWHAVDQARGSCPAHC